MTKTILSILAMAWTDHSVEALAKRVYDHTYDVLSAIKAAAVVTWPDKMGGKPCIVRKQPPRAK